MIFSNGKSMEEERLRIGFCFERVQSPGFGVPLGVEKNQLY